jgi:protein-disulfide isomerase
MDSQNTSNNTRSSLVTIPGAIIVAGAIIAIAIVWTTKPAKAPSAQNSGAQTPQVGQVNLAPITATDHILGNPNAPIKIVEFSDPSCPYCQMFNPTMEQIMSDYGPGGQVAWVYRQFPLDKPDQNGNVLHPLSGTQAEGLECAASLGGNTAFWAYEKAWYSTFPQNGASETAAVNSQQMAQVAKSAGLDAVAFNDCVTSNQFKTKIDAEYTDGINAGVSGTPFNVIITPSGSDIPLAGSVSYATLKTTIDTLISAETGSASQ